MGDGKVLLTGGRTGGKLIASTFVYEAPEPAFIQLPTICRWNPSGNSVVAVSTESLHVEGDPPLVAFRTKNLEQPEIDPDQLVKKVAVAVGQVYAETDRSELEIREPKPTGDLNLVPIAGSGATRPYNSTHWNDGESKIAKVEIRVLSRAHQFPVEQLVLEEQTVDGESTKTKTSVIESMPIPRGEDKSLQSLRFALSNDGQKLAITSPYSRHAQIDHYVRDGESWKRVSSLVPFAMDILVEGVRWISEDRLLTMAGGKLMLIDPVKRKALSEIQGPYRDPIEISHDGNWIFASRGQSVDVLNAKTLECVFRIEDPRIQEITGLALSGSQQRLALEFRDGSAKERLWVYRFDSGKVVEIPTSAKNDSKKKLIFSSGSNAFQLRWLSEDVLCRRESESAIAINLKHGIVISEHSGDLSTIESITAEQLAEFEIRQSPLAIRVGFPDERSSLRVGFRMAALKDLEGCFVGPGGNTMIITAGYRLTIQKERQTNSVERDGKLLPLPEVIYDVAFVNSEGDVISRYQAIGEFAGKRSSFFDKTVVRDGLKIQQYKFPTDYKQCIINEILSNATGLIDTNPRVASSLPHPRFEVAWKSYPLVVPGESLDESKKHLSRNAKPKKTEQGISAGKDE